MATNPEPVLAPPTRRVDRALRIRNSEAQSQAEQSVKIVHLANFYGPKSGGLKTMMLNSARLANSEGHQVWHIVPGAVNQVTDHPHFQRIEIKSPTIPRSGGYRVIRKVSEVVIKLEEIAPDVIEISDRLTLLAVADWARSRDIPTIMFAHERIDGVVKSHFRGIFAETLADILNKNAAGRVDAVIATTEFAAEEFRRIGVNPSKIPLGVDLETFQPHLRNRMNDSSIRIGICSRLSKEKRSDFAIDVLRATINRGIDAELVVIGDGPLKAEMQAASADLPVTFEGFISDRSLLAEALANLDVLLAPGPIETFGLAALEGLASGTPVIVNSASALPEVIGLAGAAAELDSELWATNIERLLAFGKDKDSATRLIARAQAEKFPWQEFWRKLSNLYANLGVITSSVEKQR